MMPPKKLDFSSPARVDEEDDQTDATPLTRQRKAASKRPASDQQEEPKKNEINIWNEDDELIILKGLVEFRARAREGNDTEFDWDGFYSFIKDLIQVQVPKKQVFKKIRELHKKFLDIRERIINGIYPHFMNITETEAFKASSLLWEINDDTDNCSEYEEDNVDAEPVNDNEAAKTNADDELVVPNENQSGEEEPHDDEPGDNNVDGEALQELVDDDLCTLKEVFDTTTSYGLLEYQKKLMGNKLMTLETPKKKELSDEWKAICSEQTRLSVKKFRFSAKLVEAANDA